jgi:LmbE family N-acetylglucosaminyl deacetylase
MPRTLLFIFAHPDDESFCGVGLAARCLAEGTRVVLVTATRGEEGKVGEPPLCSREQLPERREKELRNAAAAAGIEHVHLLGYRDKQLADADPETVRGQLVAELRRYRPQVVLTFDPNGFNRHPDHVAVSRFTSDAIAAAADPRWLPDTGPAHVVARLLWTTPRPPWEVVASPDATAEPGVDFLVDIAPWRDNKAAALRAHRTQHLSIDRYFFSNPDLDRILAVEAYRHAWGPPLPRVPCDDVFVSID